jgi:hypothetical protein
MAKPPWLPQLLTSKNPAHFNGGSAPQNSAAPNA